MIGSYRGSSGAERALKRVVEAMVMPAGVDAALHWPVFGNASRAGPLMAYQRLTSEYATGQTFRLLEVGDVVFDIYIWSSNENQVLAIMDALEGGFNVFPLVEALQATRAYLARLSTAGGPAPPGRAGDLVRQASLLLGTGTVAEQESGLAAVNRLLAELTALAVDADWTAVLASLNTLQSRLAVRPPYSFRPLGCRDLTAPEVWQLGLSGRVFSVAMEYTRY